MKTHLIITLLFCFQCARAQSPSDCFIENKGQIKNEMGRSREDIDFVLRSANGQTLLIGPGRLEYHFKSAEQQEQIVMKLKETNKAQIVAESKSDYYENYYLSDPTPIRAGNAQRICYRNIYPGIDWLLYLHEGKLEHEFVCRKGSNYQQIQWTYSGATSFTDNEGVLNVKGLLGSVNERQPECFDAKGQSIALHYVRKGDSWAYKGIGSSEEMTIDPSIEWGTYINAPSGTRTMNLGACTDKIRSIYICGWTNAATCFASSSGVHQSTIGHSISSSDQIAYISKFDTAGKHLWTTYYVGDKRSTAYNIDYYNGHLYVVGQTNSTTGIATTGTAQPVISAVGGSEFDAFLAKLDTNGMRIWGTYCGGTGSDRFEQVRISNTGSIYATGVTLSHSGIATAGAFKASFGTAPTKNEQMLLKYDQNGKLLWGTYVGGDATEDYSTLYLYNDKVYMAGETSSTNNISTPGCHQASLKGVTDAFLIQFDSTGKRNWGTYYGGAGYEAKCIIAGNKKGDVYLYGASTSSDTLSIATPGAYQTKFGGISDCFIAKFDSLGKRYWGTYIGNEGQDDARIDFGGGMAVDDAGDNDNLHIAGIATKAGMATPDAFCDTVNVAATPSKSRDVFVASINGTGMPYFFSYLGGEDEDLPSTTVFNKGSIYVSGYTKSQTKIATPGAYRTVGSTEFAGFLVKINSKEFVSLKEQKLLTKNPLRVFPNPSSGIINIETIFASAELGEATISISNVAGKTVQTEYAAVQNGRLQHQLYLFNTLQPGIYFLQVQYKNWKGTQKIVKE